MKKNQTQLPEMKVKSLYLYSLQTQSQDTTTTSACSDPTTTCGTILTTTHHR